MLTAKPADVEAPRVAALDVRPAELACMAAALALVCLYVWLLWRYAVDWPVHDDFTQILALPGYMAQLDTRGKLALLLELSPEHRIATLRLAGWLGAGVPGGLDFALLIGIGNAMLLAVAVYVLLWTPGAVRAPVALLAALLLTSPTHYAAQYLATGALQHFGVCFYAFTSLALLRGAPRHLLALAFAVAAALTSANGLMVFPAAALLLALSRRKRDALAWIVAGAAACVSYFVGYAPTAGQPRLLDVLRDPVAIAGFTLATLGGIGGTWPWQLALGAVLSAGSLGLVMSGRWRGVPPVVLASGLFFLLSCGMIAAGRANLGIDAVALSRYRVYSAGFALAAIAAFAHVVPLALARASIAAAVVAAAALYALAWPLYTTHIVELGMSQQALRDHYAATGSGRYEPYTREFGDFTLQRADRLGAYRGARKATPPVALTGGMPDASPSATPFHLDVVDGSRAFTASGWVDGRHRSVDVWLEGGGRAFRGELQVARWWRGPALGFRTGFHGTASLAGLPPGRYRLGIGDRSVAWSTHEIVVQ